MQHRITEPDFELLARLIGRDAAEEHYGGSLTALFEGPFNDRALVPLQVARELVTRWLREELRSRPVFDRPMYLKEFLILFFAGQGHESFVVLYLDMQHRLIEVEELFRGTLGQTAVYPREVVKRALHWNAGGVVLSHNHPSGLAEPSRADEFLTQSLKSALQLIDVRVLDHIVVGGNQATSFAERGLL